MPSEDCWRWPGARRRIDGRATVGGKYVYRMIFEAAFGKPPGGGLHHSCGNPWCVNPNHLEEMSQSEHAKRHGIGGDWGQADKVECKNGHPYDSENTYTYTRKDGRVERHCRICVRAAKARLRQKKKGRLA